MPSQKILRCSKEKVWEKHLMGESYVTSLTNEVKFCVCISVGSVCRNSAFYPVLMVPGSHGLTTYKELCSLASDLNQPDLVYKFMNLANHHAMWNSRKVSRSFSSSTHALLCPLLLPDLISLLSPLFREQLLGFT